MQEVEALNADCVTVTLTFWPFDHRSVEIIILYVTYNLPISRLIAILTNFRQIYLILAEEVSLKNNSDLDIWPSFPKIIKNYAENQRSQLFVWRWRGFPVKILQWPWPWIYSILIIDMPQETEDTKNLMHFGYQYFSCLAVFLVITLASHKCS